MGRNTEEARRPVEWLIGFDHDPSRYAALLRDSGSLAAAAYRLALARCRVQPMPSAVPTTAELWAAARRIALRVPEADLMSRERLLMECEEQELEVIAPMSARNAA
jgi:hypothetical protein